VQVFLCFKMLLTSGSSATQVNGCLMYVFNIQGFITHIVVYRCAFWAVSGLVPNTGGILLPLVLLHAVCAAATCAAGSDRMSHYTCCYRMRL
jgi:hypothetical protein